MLVAYRLHQAGFTLKRSPKKGGPDFVAAKEGLTFQVEVVTPEPLSEITVYLQRPKDRAFTVPSEHFLMNWTKGISAKMKQLFGDAKKKG
jgi:hypothetical protein